MERECEEVEDKEQAELDAPHGSLSSTCGIDEEGDDEDAEAARDDVGDVGERAVVAHERDAALWVHADGRGRGIRGDVLENSWVVMLQLMEMSHRVGSAARSK